MSVSTYGERNITKKGTKTVYCYSLICLCGAACIYSMQYNFTMATVALYQITLSGMEMQFPLPFPRQSSPQHLDFIEASFQNTSFLYFYFCDNNAYMNCLLDSKDLFPHLYLM